MRPHFLLNSIFVRSVFMQSQLINAAQNGRTDEMCILMDEGANIQHREMVRLSFEKYSSNGHVWAPSMDQ